MELWIYEGGVEEMKALITAAGLGTRMGNITNNTNKCLLPVGGKSLLRNLVNTFKEQGISEIFVITGHCAELVERELEGEVTFIYNKDYASTSILGSIILAEKYLKGSDFIFSTGDSLLHPQLIKKMIHYENKENILLCVDIKKCDEEDMKIIIKDSVIIDISKKIPIGEATGEYTGLTYFPGKASKVFFTLIEKSLMEESKNQYVALMLLLLQHQGFKPIPIYTEGLPRIEIDYPKDLESARELYTLFPVKGK